MATLALGALGAAAGSALLPAGLSVLGTTITGAAIGSQIGAMAGHVVDQALFGSSGRQRIVDGPRLSDVRITSSTEGAPIPRLYGRARLGGQIIWACNLSETVVARGSSSGGASKGGRSSSNVGSDYLYSANFAIGLCEGPISSVGRVWADGKEIDLSKYTHRLYTGASDQPPDALIEAKQGADQSPAYRGLAYIVFEQMPLADFGNRIPQLSFEIFSALDGLSQQIRAISLIPGSGEFAYAPSEITRSVGRAASASENVHSRQGGTDWSIALDQLQSALPNAKSVSLVVSWFGTSLNAAQCQLRPAVESADKVTSQAWSVSGLQRNTAALVSSSNGRPAFGGTPSDQSVVDAIRDLKKRGLSPVLSPFILMDVPAGNTLADPYTSSASQSVYPWRGRITVSPAAGRSNSIDKSAAAAVAIAQFAGVAQPSHFSLAGDAVVYSGPPEFGFRRMILHHAMLAKAAGGVDAFVLCSELRGLTQVRSATGVYPFVTVLKQLAADVRSILGSATKIVYAADWSEYFGHQPADGSGDVYFHLDPLWASPDVDAIGIDCYWPLSDWRDGANHRDAIAGTTSIYDPVYLQSNIAGGEGYAWYYATAADRALQVRTSITDGGGKPWVFRFKDLTSWWKNAHFDRPAGVERTTPTAWVPQSKPVWFMELGCPAVDKGANQPNVFVDPKSSESSFPHFSTRARDDTMQRSYLQAFHDAYDPASTRAVAGLNPVSSVYGAPMLDLARMHVYCWDARPSPAFPNEQQTWGDSDNWALGHWITGRIASVPLGALLSRILSDYGFAKFDTRAIAGMVPGFVLDRIMSARDALQPLELAYFFDCLESDGQIVFRHRAASVTGFSFATSDLVETRPGAKLSTITRAQETDLPASAKIAYIAAGGVYPQAIASARRISGGSHRTASAVLPLVLDTPAAGAVADTWLFESWAARERATFSLPPSKLALEPGDLVALSTGGRSYRLRITEIGEHGTRDVHALSIDPDVYAVVPVSARTSTPSVAVATGQPLSMLLDLPRLVDDDNDFAGYAVATQAPWPGTVAAWRSPEASGFTLKGLLPTPATTGLTANAFLAGPTWRLDKANRLVVDIDVGALLSTTRLQLLAGRNFAAVEYAPNAWEVIQFETATLIGTKRYELKTLLRGQLGTDPTTLATIPAGSRFVLLDGAVVSLAMTADDVGVPFNWRIGPASRDIGDASYSSSAHTFRGVGLIPLRPVHLRGQRTNAGDLTASWLRRTRRSGDGWESADVPLAEDSEAYVVEILASAAVGAPVRRTFMASAATCTYTVAEQVADFGSAQPQITLRVAQFSRSIGRGTATTSTL
jgi:GTA TIM-barrel-like domain/Putative phage tail protein